MAQLFDVIRKLVAEERYVVGQHASERLEERGIMEWQSISSKEVKYANSRRAKQTDTISSYG